MQRNVMTHFAAASIAMSALLLSGCVGLKPAAKPPTGAAAQANTQANTQTNKPPNNAAANSVANTAAPRANQDLPQLPAAGSGRGGYYQDDGPGENPPEGLLDTPDAEPRIETFPPNKNKPYVVFGKTYAPFTDERPFKQRGVGSWYGRKFHGQRTSSGEPYDMYKMTAAHPTLPIPSYARVTNLDNGKQVIVRVNDRGPFHAGRICDLSYTAALRLGMLGKGSHQIEIERILNDEIELLAARRKAQAETQTAQLGRAERVERTEPPTQVQAKDSAADAIDATNITNSANAAKADEAQVTLVLATMLESAGNAARAPSGKSGYYLQFGAYAQFDNAKFIHDKLNRNWGATNLPALELVQAGNLYRLYSGPFDSRAQAQAAVGAAQQLAQNELPSNAWPGKPLIVQRAQR